MCELDINNLSSFVVCSCLGCHVGLNPYSSLFNPMCGGCLISASPHSLGLVPTRHLSGLPRGLHRGLTDQALGCAHCRGYLSISTVWTEALLFKNHVSYLGSCVLAYVRASLLMVFSSQVPTSLCVWTSLNLTKKHNQPPRKPMHRQSMCVYFICVQT